MQISAYQPQNRLYRYKSYCKYSLLYEAVMGHTNDFNEVTISLILSLFILLESSEKILQAMWAAARPPSPVSSMLLLWKARHVGTQEKTTPQDHWQLCRIDKTNRFSSATKLSQLSQKWSCTLGREVSTAGRWLPFVVSGRWASVVTVTYCNKH